MTGHVPDLAAESKNPVMLLNERRRALKWEERLVNHFATFTIFLIRIGGNTSF